MISVILERLLKAVAEGVRGKTPWPVLVGYLATCALLIILMAYAPQIAILSN